MTKYIAVIITTILYVIAVGCSSENDPMTDGQASLCDIVSFDGNGTNGISFSFQEYDDSPLITLTAPGISIEGLTDGERVMIAYVPLNGEVYASTDIELRGCVRIVSDSLRVGKLDGWNNTPVWVNSMWRSGRYINLDGMVAYSNSPRAFSLLIDQATADNAIPDLYLMHSLDTDPDNFSRRIYASWFIGNLWDKPQCHGIRIHVSDENRKINTFTFLKPDNQ